MSVEYNMRSGQVEDRVQKLGAVTRGVKWKVQREKLESPNMSETQLPKPRKRELR